MTKLKFVFISKKGIIINEEKKRTYKKQYIKA
jgi:hypothetical protein